jgi:hypothetical protein
MRTVRYLTAVGLQDLPNNLRGDKNDIREMDEETAAGFVANGLAEYIDAEQLVAEAEEKLVEKQAELTLPKTYHGKDAWIAWAVAHGYDPEVDGDKTKNELMSEYGERL